MSFYEMSIENGFEYIRTGVQNVRKLPIGMWIIAFSDVDFRKLSEKCRAHAEDESARGTLGEVFYGFFQELRKTEAPKHPLLREFVEEQLLRILFTTSVDKQPFGMSDEFQYYNALRQDEPVPQIGDEYPRIWFRHFSDRFNQLARFQDFLIPLIDSVMGVDPYGKGTAILRSYYEMRTREHDYLLQSERLYNELAPRFFLSVNDKLCDLNARQPKELEASEKVSGHIYQTTDSLEAITLWAFDMLCAQGCRLARCKLCNRMFLPYSVSSCYCERPVEDKPGKTCKDIGATMTYQLTVNSDAAKQLFGSVANRVQTYAMRHSKTDPEMVRIYKKWRFNAKLLLEKVEANEMTYEEFEKLIDHKSSEILSKDGELF